MNEHNPTISKGIDWTLAWIYLLLVAVGIIAIFAVTYKESDPIVQSFFGFKTDYSKQFYFFLASAVIGIFILLTDSKFFTATANIWYAFGIFLLLLVFPFHSRVKGTESIIRFGGFQFQPAEFCKICVCLALAKYLSRPDTNFTKIRAQLIAASIVLFPAALTLMQSETGLALVFFSFNTLALILTAIAILFIYFMPRQIRRKRYILFNVALIWLVCVGVQRFGVPFAFKHVLKLYQVERIYSTVGKEVPNEYVITHQKELLVQTGKKKDPDYNVKQSKIAIGSGGLTGKGLLRSTQTRYGFVPEQRTDFIFDTIGEGFGFVGSIILLGIYLLLLFRIVTMAERQRSVFSRCYAYGVAAVFFFHLVINVGMTVGLAPVIGIPLPFISYGGTSLLTFTVLLFILIRLDADRQMVLR